MDAIDYIRSFRAAFAARDESAAAALAEDLRREPWPTVALVAYRTMAIARPDDAETRWHSPRLAPVLLESFGKSTRPA
jgi:hypothetical protein